MRQYPNVNFYGVQGIETIAGDITMPLFPDSGMSLWFGALGTDGVTGSGPYTHTATMRSTATVKSSSVTSSALRRVATSAASLQRLASSAPEKPGVSSAIFAGSTPAARTVALEPSGSSSRTSRPLVSWRAAQPPPSNRPAARAATAVSLIMRCNLSAKRAPPGAACTVTIIDRG